MKTLARKLHNYAWDFSLKKIWCVFTKEPFDVAFTIFMFLVIASVSALFTLYYHSHPWMMVPLLGVVAGFFTICCRITSRGTHENTKIARLTEELGLKEQEIATWEQKAFLEQQKVANTQAELTNLKHRGMQVFASERECFLSFFRVNLSEVFPYDYLVEDQKLTPWDGNKEITAGAYRIAGARRIQKEAHVGLDLNKIMVKVDEESRQVEYVLPETEVFYGSEETNQELHHLVLEADTGFFHKIRHKAVTPDQASWKLEYKRNLRELDKQIRDNADEGYKQSPTLENSRGEVENIIKKKIVEPRLKHLGYHPVQAKVFSNNNGVCSINELVQKEFLLT